MLGVGKGLKTTSLIIKPIRGACLSTIFSLETRMNQIMNQLMPGRQKAVDSTGKC